MEHLVPRALISSWTTTPIPGLTLSAGGILALADLQTVARRTALAGGSSWFDALVLAPGLHYHQACDSLDREDLPGWFGGQLTAVEVGGAQVRYVINNIVTLNYLKQLYRDGGSDVLMIDVGLIKPSALAKKVQQMLIRKRTLSDKDDDDDENLLPDLDWMSHLLYLVSPTLTVAAITFMVLLEDWWGLSFILALILSRLMNIWAIKQRSKPSALLIRPSNDGRLTEYAIDIGLGRSVRIRGIDTDLQALTTQAWLRAKSHVDGYLEASAKLIVFLVAALSGNLSQAGAIVLVSLLLISAALLGLSNAHMKGFRMHGRYALPKSEVDLKKSVVEGGHGEGGTRALQDAV
ncbi:Fc.00g057310.m01.CDS01 [Cosmosporella sp. VM-42]